MAMRQNKYSAHERLAHRATTWPPCVPTSHAHPRFGVSSITTIICIILFLFPFSSASAHTLQPIIKGKEIKEGSIPHSALAGNGRIFGRLLDGTKNNSP